MATTYTCDGCGAMLSSGDELIRESTTTGRSWYCRYCRTPVPSVGRRAIVAVAQSLADVDSDEHRSPDDVDEDEYRTLSFPAAGPPDDRPAAGGPPS